MVQRSAVLYLLSMAHMPTSDAYGQRLGELMLAESAHAVVTRTLRKADMAVTEIE
jgi:hypothetical protein